MWRGPLPYFMGCVDHAPDALPGVNQLIKENSMNTEHVDYTDTALRGSCHCGTVCWTLAVHPSAATACNCTVCRRYGALWAYGYADLDIQLNGPTSTYVRGKAIAFHFCRACGCMVYYLCLRTEPDGRLKAAVNLRMCQPDDVAQVPIDHFDGLVKFDDEPRDGRCVADYWY